MAKTLFPSDQQDKFMLRLPDGMRDRIKRVAEANNRSMNAEILDTLEEKYPDHLGLPDLADFLIAMLRKSGITDITDPSAEKLLREASLIWLFDYYGKMREIRITPPKVVKP